MRMRKAKQPDNATIYKVPKRASDFAQNGTNNDREIGTFEEVGSEGLSAFYGHVSETYTEKLEWPGAYDTLNQMRRRDPTLRSLSNVIKLMARQTEIKAVAASDSGPDLEGKEFLESCLGDTSHTIEDFIDDIFSFIAFGWSSFNVVYKMRNGPEGKVPSLKNDGKIGWKKFAFRRQSSFDSWEFDDTGGFAGWWQIAAPEYRPTFLPIENLLHFVSERDGGNPEGLGLFESIYESWHFVKNLQIINGIGWQRTFVGLPVFNHENIPTPTDKAAIQAVGEGLTVGEKSFASLPPGISMKLESTANTGAGSLLDTIKMYRALMLQTVLAEFVMKGMMYGGALGSSTSDQSEIFLMGVNGWLDKILAIWNRFGVRRLFDFEVNKIPGLTELPQLTHTKVMKPNIAELGQFISQIAPHIKLGDDDQLWIREQSGMPEMIPEEETEKPTEDTPKPGVEKVEEEPTADEPAEEEPTEDEPLDADAHAQIIGQVLRDLKGKNDGQQLTT